MKRTVVNVFCSLFFLTAFFAPLAKPASGMLFENNPVSSGGLTQQFTAGGHVLGFQATGVYIASSSHSLHIEFVGANHVEPASSQTEKLTTAPFGQAQPLDKVTWANLWDGISLSYQAVPDGIAESVYVIDAGAPVEAIRLRYNVPVSLNGDGSLAMDFETGLMIESAPRAWQTIGDQRIPVGVFFRELVDNEVGFALSGYDPAFPLTIDPLLMWTAYLGGSEAYDNDQAKAIAVDGNGNVYIGGLSRISWGSPKRLFSDERDAFAAKLDSDGNLLWNTFLGGFGDDTGVGIAVDPNGNVYMTGTSDATWGAPARLYQGADDAWAAKINPAGDLQWNTFLGSAGTDYSYGIAVNSSGNPFVVGYSTSDWGAPISPFVGGGDAFVVKLAGANGILGWSTFLGGTAADSGKAIAVTDSAVYVTGGSSATWGAVPKRPYTAGGDGFAAKLNSTSGVLQWNTFLGGDGNEYGTAITLDGNGNIYIAGDADATWGAPVRAFDTAPESFAAKLDSTGALVWNTFLGGPGYEYTHGIAADAYGNVFVTGETGWVSWGSPNIPFTGSYSGYAAQLNATSGELGWNTFLNGPTGYAGSNGIAVLGMFVYLAGNSQTSFGTPIRAMSGSPEAYAAQLSLSGILLWNTFMGGSDDDFVTAIAVDDSGNSFVTGYSNMPWGEPVNDYWWKYDAFVAKLDAAGALVWNTFLGGDLNDYGYSVAVDGDGSVYVAGVSSDTWGSSPVRLYTGGADAFVAALDDATGVMRWNTFLGGAGNEGGYGIAEDRFGGTYVTGYSTASWGSPVRNYTGGTDAFAAKLNYDGVLVWNTFLGGSGSDGGYGIAADATTALYVVGNSNASWGSPAHAYTASTDAFAVKLAPSTGVLQWNTFVGGTGLDEGMAITLGWGANILIAGDTAGGWSASAEEYTEGGGGGVDAYVANISTITGNLIWSTFVGGSGTDYGTAVALDPDTWDIYLVGDTLSGWPASFTEGGGGGEIAFITQVEPTGVIGWTNFLGDAAEDYGTGVGLDGDGAIYVAGYTHPIYGSFGWEGFVTRVNSHDFIYLPLVHR